MSRLNIIRAIRDLPEPPPRRSRRRWLVVGIGLTAVGAALTVQGVSTTEGFALLLGPTLVIVGLTPLAARVLGGRRVFTAAAVLVVVWGASLFALVPSSTKGASIMLFVVQGVVLTAAAVLLASLQQDRLSRLLRSLTGGRSLSLRLGLAYPLARRSRTGLTIAMYALVVFILTFITSIAHMIDSEVAVATDRVRGGYDIVVSSSSANPVRADQLKHLDGVLHVAPLARTSGLFRVGEMKDDVLWNVDRVRRPLRRGRSAPAGGSGSFPSDDAAWRAVLRNPNLAIVDPVFLSEGGGPADFVAEPGTRIRVKDPFTGRRRTFTVAALAPADYFIENGVFMGLAGAETLFGYPLSLDRLYVDLAPRVDPDTFAADLEATYLRNGTEAVGIRTIMEEGFTMTHQIFQLFQGYLAMGLIVGIAGTAVVAVRAVRERRRQIGTLRAIGFSARPVGRSFAIETGFVAVEGTVIGCVLALVTLYDIVAMSDSFGDVTLLRPVPEPRAPARRHGRRLPARDGLAGDLGQPHPACGRAADDGLKRRHKRQVLRTRGPTGLDAGTLSLPSGGCQAGTDRASAARQLHAPCDRRTGERDARGDDEHQPVARGRPKDSPVVEPALEGRPAHDESSAEHAGNADPRASDERAGPAEREGGDDEDEPPVVRSLCPVEGHRPVVRPRREHADHRRSDCRQRDESSPGRPAAPRVASSRNEPRC